MSGPRDTPLSLGRKYQIRVTVWCALNLLFKRRCCTEIFIEPPSWEDIAVVLDADDTTAGGPLEIQAKEMRVKPLSVDEFVKILQGKSTKPGKRGPKRRERPLEMLKKDPTLRYVVVTDAQPDGRLKDFRIENLGDYSTAKPIPKLKEDPALLQRIGIIERRSRNVLRHDADSILRRLAHVPEFIIRACYRELETLVARRIDGEEDGHITVTMLKEIFRKYDGLPAPLPPLVLPTIYPTMQAKLDQEHALVITGTSGIGKSSLADSLKAAYQTGASAYRVVDKYASLAEVHKALRRPGEACLFFAEDPWGQYKLEDDPSDWARAIPDLLAEANIHKKFLIVSRSEILKEGVSDAGRKLLARAELAVAAEHYTPEMMAKILRAEIQRARPDQRDILLYHRDEILRKLKVPLELKNVVSFALQETKKGKIGDIEALIKQAHVLYAERALTDDLCRRPLEEICGVVIVWCLLMSHGKLDPAVASDYRRLLEHSTPPWLTDPDKVIDWLRAGNWLEPVPKTNDLKAHPTVLDALEETLNKKSLPTERTLMTLLNALLANDRAAEALEIARHLRRRKLELPPPARDTIDRFLLAQLETATAQSFRALSADLSLYGGTRDPVSLICRAVIPAFHRGFEVWPWKPPKLTPDQVALIRASDAARTWVGKWIEYELSEQISSYIYPPKLLGFLHQFEWDLSPSFFAAAEQALDFFNNNAPIELLIEGALSGANPDYHGLMDAVLKAAEANHRKDLNMQEQYRLASQDEMEEADSNWFESASEEISWVNKALATFVKVRRQREGNYTWMTGHPQVQLFLKPWAAALDASAGAQEVGEIVRLAGTANRQIGWNAIGNARDSTRLPDLLAALPTAGMEEAKSLLEALVAFNGQVWNTQILPALLQLPPSQRAALYLAWHPWEPDMIKERCRIEASVFDPDWVEAIHACETRPFRHEDPPDFSTLTAPVRNCLAQLTLEAPPEQGYKAAAVLQTLGAVPAGAWHRMLASEDHHARELGIKLCAREGEEGKRTLLQSAHDPHYQCRKAALSELASLDDLEARDAVLVATGDASGSVRAEAARLIGERRWTESIPFLARMLRDPYHEIGPSGSAWEYPVSQAACAALAEFSTLPAEVLDETMRMFDWSNFYDDANLQDGLLKLLAKHLHPPLIPFLADLLGSRVSVSNRSEPLFQLRASAAWAMVRQVCRFAEAGANVPLPALMKAALHPDPLLAAPALLTVGLLAKRTAGQLESLHRHEQMTANRASLVFLGALGGKLPLDKSYLESVAPGHPLLALTPGEFDSETVAIWEAFAAEHTGIAAWILSIDTKDPVQRAVKWAGEALFKLPDES